MNDQILAYLIYGCITIYLIVWVGRLFHRNGRIFILRLFKGETKRTDTTNNLLLVAYYLFNIGYAVTQFSFWTPVIDLEILVASIAWKTGILVCILAVTHYFNMAMIYWLSKRTIHSSTQTKIV